MLDELPLEIIEHVFSWLRVIEVVKIGLVSKEWYRYSCSENVWMLFIKQKGTALFEYDIPYREYYLRMIRFKWEDPIGKYNSVLTNDNRTVTKTDPETWDYYRADVTLLTGNHQWEVTLNRAKPPFSIPFDNEDETATFAPLLIGVEHRVPTTSPGAKGWVMSCGNGKLINNSKFQSYTGILLPIEGCVIQVDLDLDKGTLGYIIDGVDHGIAFTNITSPVSPAISIIGSDTTATLSFKHSLY